MHAQTLVSDEAPYPGTAVSCGESIKTEKCGGGAAESPRRDLSISLFQYDADTASDQGATDRDSESWDRRFGTCSEETRTFMTWSNRSAALLKRCISVIWLCSSVSTMARLSASDAAGPSCSDGHAS